MSYSIEVRKSAERLRRRGESIPNIAQKLGIAKSTISLWVKGVTLPEHLRKVLEGHSMTGRQKGNAFRKAVRIHNDGILEMSAKKDATLLKRAPEFWRFTAALLYWCEGGKQNGSSGVQFTNSDPELMKTFLFALRTGFTLDEVKFRVLMHLHGYHNENEQETFWTNITGIPKEQFQKTYKKPNTGKRKHKGYQGCISLKYYDVRIVRSLTFLYTSFAQSI